VAGVHVKIGLDTCPSRSMMKKTQYTHSPLGQEVRSISGQYVIDAEQRLPFNGREVLVALGYMSIDSSCCGTGGCGFALVAGYILQWQVASNEKGEPVSEIELIQDEQDKAMLRAMILEANPVQQVNFW